MSAQDAESVAVQPFSDEEIEHLAAFASIDPAKVRGIAWLTALKLKEAGRTDD